MKKRIYKINNKNLVTGNPNEVTENEILVKENNDGTVELSHRNNGTLETLGNDGNGGGNIKYYDVSGLPQEAYSIIKMVCMSVKCLTANKPENPLILTSTLLSEVTVDKFLAASFCLDMKVSLSNDITQLRTVYEILQGFGGVEAFPEITEEEYYDLTLPTE